MPKFLMHSPTSIVEAFNEINSGELTNTIFLNANVVMLAKHVYHELLEQVEAHKDKVKESSHSVMLSGNQYKELTDQIESLTKQLELANSLKHVKISNRHRRRG